jgi:hypothetical protein
MEGGHRDLREGEIPPVPPVDWSERFPELGRLFTAYLVESWRSLHGSPAEALSEGLEDLSEDELRAALGDVNDLLALRLGEQELRHVLFRHLGSYYIPSARTCTEWLEEVAGQMDDAIHARTASG